MSLSGKVVVVTGSTYGIGRAIARGCARAGARVVVNSRRPEAVEATVTELIDSGSEATGLAADVRDEDALRGLLDRAIAEFGGVDVWVNNAGIGQGYRPHDELTEQDIACIVDTNIVGTMLACRMLVPYFAERGGVILNLGGRGSRGDSAPFTAAYAATKAAVTSLTKSLAAENRGRPVSIHQVMPGMVRTGFYEDMPVSDSLASSAGNVDLVLDAIGVPEEVVGDMVARAAAQEPGRSTGKTYSAFSGWRRVRGIAKLAWYGMTGKMTKATRS